MKHPMTSRGIAALKDEREAIKERLCCHTQDRDAFPIEHTPERLLETSESFRDEAFWASRLAQVSMLLDTVEPVVVKQFRTVQLGQKVTVMHLDSHEEKGEFPFVIGGEHEPDAYGKLKTVSYVSPYARALIGKSVGDEVDVVLPSGERIPIEITAIEPAPGEQLQLAIAG